MVGEPEKKNGRVGGLDRKMSRFKKRRENKQELQRWRGGGCWTF